MEQAEIDFQRKCQDFVSRYVLLRQSMTMELIQQANEDWFEDCVNMYRDVCPECGGDIEDNTSEDSDEDYICTSCKHETDSPESESAEVYEWWAIGNWLADRLESNGEVIFDGPDCKLWGRQATGQAIALDGVICAIVKNLED
jgi:hypothetical protein